uniref:Uncharacterized protein n=1 Tax=Arundo donax TaxID=35708 RepID=A0A0A9EB96_ARUDO
MFHHFLYASLIPSYQSLKIFLAHFAWYGVEASRAWDFT